MVWKIEFDPSAQRELDKLDSQQAKRILKFLLERVAKQSNPRNLGEALTGSRYGDLWKYRVGDYRIISHISDKEILILVVKIGNRRDVYR